ncbi:esterase/lipase family protein [Aldersonia kunmingensis]|uniref:esterase/lipase family protein n=1 Tax=Aldersonia kunmingensis TaxID=408066 RepID=UPI000833BDFE|nr:alpha/beta fold hydrolase [Aldersonia kunmingensis]
MSRSTLPRLVAALACTAGLGLGALPVAGADPAPSVPPAVVPMQPGPEQFTPGDAIRYAATHPDTAPPGANDFACRSRPGQLPVILAHGTDTTAYTDWAGLSPKLKAAGYCVFALNYGGKAGADHYGTEEMSESAVQLRDFVSKVRSATGAAEVDLVGFSQGATVTRYYINRLGGASEVRRWVGLASPSYGGAMFGAVALARAIPGGVEAVQDFFSLAVVQQMVDSPFLVGLNAGSDTVPGVEYTTIGSRYDEMIQPSSNIALHGAGATNIVVQDLCPIDMTGHFNMPYDAFSQQLVLNALDPSRTVVPECRFVPLGTNIAGVVAAANF